MTLVATVDAGGSGVKVGVVSTESWQTVASVRREYSASVPAPGLLEWDPAAWWPVVEGALGDAVAKAGRFPAEYAGIACTGMRIPFVVVDDHCEPLAPGMLAPDVRGRAYTGPVCDLIGGDRLYATTGHWSAPHFGLPKLLWFVRERAALWRRARWVLQLCDWLLERLCGTVASEPSSASMSQMLDVSRREWAADLLATAGIDAARLPPLRDAGSHAGGLRAGVAARVGLLAGTPVHVGGGDTHMACLGAAGLAGGSVAIVAGTTTPLMLATREPRLDMEVAPLVSVHVGPGTWAAETNVGTSGAMLRWLRDLTGRGYDELEALAATSPAGARDVLVCASNPQWGPVDWARVPPVALVGAGPGYGLADVARAVLESSAHAIACNLARLDRIGGGPPAGIVLTGDGARTPFAAQLLADVLGRAVTVPELDSAAALGGALLLTGLDRPPLEPPRRLYEPDAERHALYAAHTRRYADAFARLAAAGIGDAA